jgi:hypothetical protein
VVLVGEDDPRGPALGEPVDVDQLDAPTFADVLPHAPVEGRPHRLGAVDDALEVRQLDRLPLLVGEARPHQRDHAGDQEDRRRVVALHPLDGAANVELLLDEVRAPGGEAGEQARVAAAAGEERREGLVDAALVQAPDVGRLVAARD